ncbi:unnamed protein product [Cylindrotheca closterium]|uniref:Copper transporter n=1 Tax=Cylindrotheca closterium TaxID=2856 RepID=A0AAD2PXB1_9STRA|nr:unnamed protein product [Cylindrotheca closterium]
MQSFNVLTILLNLFTLVASSQAQETAATAIHSRQHVVPTFSLDEIQLGHRLPELSEVLRTTGLFAVKVSPQSSPSRLEAMNGLCQCLNDNHNDHNHDFHNDHHRQQQQQQQLESILLPDGHTQRTTIATATIGQDPLPLDDNGNDIQLLCGSNTVNAMETVRDEVAVVSKAVVQSMDRLLLGDVVHGGGGGAYDKRNEGPLLETKYGSSYRTMASIVHSANHLEHFHHYQQKKKKNNNKTRTEPSFKTVEWHTDAGLFLTFLPAHDCESGGTNQDDSFWVQLADGEQAQAYFEPGSVAVMMGAGAEHWLHQSISPILRATRHAVKMTKNTSRVWYGMMHLVPEDSIIQESPQRTFGDMKQNLKVSSSQQQGQGAMDEETVAIGCGPSTDDDAAFPLYTAASSSSSRRRRRLQHVQDASACNNVTNFFCWTQCLEIPNYEQAESYVNEGNSLYCLDPGILAKSGNQVPKAVEPCIGKVHNSNCQGIWHKTSPSVEGWPVEYNSTSQVEEKYCYGGTSMYMDGFHWIHDTTCVIYLFPSFVLSSQARFIGACFGTILFGMMVEAIIFRRRKSIVNFEPGMSRLLASAGFYALQLTMGYLVMLIVMTYSIPLFLCCISGLVLGHVVFNARDALFNRAAKSAIAGGVQDETIDNVQEGGCGCHEEKQSFSATSTEGTQQEATAQSCCSSNNTKIENKPAVQDRTHGVPEGSTPCCQNSLDVC